MTISITAYAPNAFTKYGRLKKKAHSEMGRLMVDVEPYTAGSIDSFLEETAQELKKSYHSFRSPYVFSHIECVNKLNGETVRIFEEYNRITTSPVKLLALLTS